MNSIEGNTPESSDLGNTDDSTPVSRRTRYEEKRDPWSDDSSS